MYTPPGVVDSNVTNNSLFPSLVVRYSPSDLVRYRRLLLLSLNDSRLIVVPYGIRSMLNGILNVNSVVPTEGSMESDVEVGVIVASVASTISMVPDVG